MMIAAKFRFRSRLGVFFGLLVVMAPPNTGSRRYRRSVHRSVNVHHNVDVHRNVNVHRDVDIDIDRHWFRPGFGVGVAAGAVAGTAAGIAIGAAVAAPTRGYLPVYYGGVNYAYYGGYYYQPAATGYVVVKPPLGAIVPTLPPGATATTVNGQTYFVYNDTYYKPVLVNGATGYQVVQL